MTITNTRFGAITIDGQTYDHDHRRPLAPPPAPKTVAVTEAPFGESYPNHAIGRP